MFGLIFGANQPQGWMIHGGLRPQFPARTAAALCLRRQDLNLRPDYVTCCGAISACEKGHQWQAALELLQAPKKGRQLWPAGRPK